MDGINSGFGTWNPIAWTLLFLGVLMAALLVRSLGRKDYKRASGQTRVFLSGNEEPDNREALHVRGEHLYWGMIEGLSGYYRRTRAAHTGVLSDYVAWYVGALAAVFIILVLVG
jgi:hypothetical protein